MTMIKVDIFRPSGKHDSTEYMDIPDGIDDNDIRAYIRINARMRNTTYLFNGLEYDVSYLVHIGD